MIFAAADRAGSVSTFDPMPTSERGSTSRNVTFLQTVPCSAAMLAQRDALDQQVQNDQAKANSAAAADKISAYASTFMQLADNMRLLAKINGVLDACAGATAGAQVRAVLTPYTTQRHTAYQDLLKSELKLNGLWSTKKANYAAWLKQLRSTVGLHRTVSKLDAMIARDAEQQRQLLLQQQQQAQQDLLKQQQQAEQEKQRSFDQRQQEELLRKQQQQQDDQKRSFDQRQRQDEKIKHDDGNHALPSADQPVIEQRSQPDDSGMPGAGQPLVPTETVEPTLYLPLWKRPWFWPVAVGVGLVTAGLLWRQR